MIKLRDHGLWSISDSSVNGTFVNNERVSSRVLAHGDLISFGGPSTIGTSPNPWSFRFEHPYEASTEDEQASGLQTLPASIRRPRHHPIPFPQPVAGIVPATSSDRSGSEHARGASGRKRRRLVRKRVREGQGRLHGMTVACQ